MNKKALVLGAGIALIAGVTAVVMLWHRPEKPSSPAQAGGLHHGDTDISFGDRVLFYREMQKARDKFRIGVPDTPFDERYPAGTFDKQVEIEVAKGRVLMEKFGVTLTTRDLQDELDRMTRDSRRPDILEAIKNACRNDPEIMRRCIAEPVVVERKLREIFAGLQQKDPSLQKVNYEQWLEKETAPYRRL
jgi:hypothetical protein